MIVVIIAGGSGTRLWPLSQSNYPKHLLKLTGEKSLLQNTYARAKEITKNIYTVTEASHSDEVAVQLPELTAQQIIVEPFRRGTASCIMLALAAVRQRHRADEPVVFLHADHHITDSAAFAAAVKAAASLAGRERAIALIGLEPKYPATGFGYIEKGSKLPAILGSPAFKVKVFKEKPSLELAQKYCADGQHLWNLGLFAAPIRVFEEEFAAHDRQLAEAYKKIRGGSRIDPIYKRLESKPVDTAIIEKSKRTVAVPGSFDWADIGSYFDLHKILAGARGNAVKGDIELIDCEDSMVHGHDKPIVAIGLSGVVIVDSPHGLLVCSKESAQLVGEVAKKLQAKDTKKS